MKRCPACSRVYDDVGLRFCLDDGAALANKVPDGGAPETAFMNPSSSERVPSTIQAARPDVAVPGLFVPDIKSKVLRHLIEDLIAAHGENLASITLYGSTAVEDTSDESAHHNVLVVLRGIALEDLRLSVEPLRVWSKASQPMPVYFSLDELQRAADVFPIEFLQMQKARRVLHGSDPLQLVETSDANLRHQLEYELRTKFLQLRRLYFPAAQSAEKLAALMVESLSSFAALFRAVLMLRGREVPVAKRDAIHVTANELGLDVAPFDRILELSSSPRAKLNATEANEIFGAYLNQLERVIDAVDQIQGN